MSLLSRGRKARFDSPLERLQHVMGNDLTVMIHTWREVMDKQDGIPDRKTTKDLLRRACDVARALHRFEREAARGNL